MRIDYNRFMTDSLKAAPWGVPAAQIMAAALEAVDPAAATQRHLIRTENKLELGDKTFDLTQYKRIFLIGAGKAGAPMTRAVVECLDKRLEGGVVIVKEGYASDASELAAKGVEILEAGHPIPDERGRRGTLRIMEQLEGLTAEDLVLCVISGGGSALMHALVPGVSLLDLQHLTTTLLAVGADIQEINTLRKHLDQIKGGGLARAAAPAQVVTLILSDVIRDPLDVIASGPTVPDGSTFADAWDVLARYKLLDKVPGSIRDHLERGLRGEVPDTPKQGHPIFTRVTNCIVGNNLQAAEAALQAAREAGYSGVLLTTEMQGEASQAGRALGALVRLVKQARQDQNRTVPVFLVAGGETTVTIRGDGKGGRNQELALGAVEELADVDGVGLMTLATDGGDGPTDAAGAVVTGDSLKRASVLGFEPRDFLSRNDSYHFFAALGDLIKTGPTQTNVNDLTFLFIE
jgi:glycerate 2-kinase